MSKSCVSNDENHSLGRHIRVSLNSQALGNDAQAEPQCHGPCKPIVFVVVLVSCLFVFLRHRELNTV